ncbi:MAG: hypothetical protein D8M58_08230 [Calditrichaeota bacterium]|nr:MAG: hypothetical protein DWQ03_18260 [Calditrichota bacterium]MBL1205370.1 hypothetical protein [Calditrichota bacterium]NOG45199.1 hypothetical protein [Calditrichota bacterium]
MNNTILSKTLLLIAFLSIFFACKQSAITKNNELQELKSMMTGSFSSIEQSEADTNFFDIRLEMVQIWNEREDAIWLYVEQAASWALEKPYRQRVYRLERRTDGTFESAVFTFDNPLRFAGAWKEQFPLETLTPDSLTERKGCVIFLEKHNGTFSGSTNQKNCESTLRGSTYATSEVRIEKNVLTSWDRGFDSDDKQVWGAETGPYIFKKLEDYK